MSKRPETSISNNGKQAIMAFGLIPFAKTLLIIFCNRHVKSLLIFEGLYPQSFCLSWV